MIRKPISAAALAAAALGLILFLAGCGKSPPTHFYSLTAVPADGTREEGAGRQCPSLGVGPVEFPAYLDRSQIVTTGAGVSMRLAEFDQWIEPVRNNFERILIENLSGGVCAGPVMSFPWPAGMRPERQVAVQVRRFDGELGATAVLRADWSIQNEAGEVLLWRATTASEKAQGPDYAALVDAQSRLVDILARDIAAGLAQVRLKK